MSLGGIQVPGQTRLSVQRHDADMADPADIQVHMGNELRIERFGGFTRREEVFLRIVQGANAVMPVSVDDLDDFEKLTDLVLKRFDSWKKTPQVGQ